METAGDLCGTGCVAREKNSEADELVNEILDKETGKTKFEPRADL